jgi:hypothetical protein
MSNSSQFYYPTSGTNSKIMQQQQQPQSVSYASSSTYYQQSLPSHKFSSMNSNYQLPTYQHNSTVSSSRGYPMSSSLPNSTGLPPMHPPTEMPKYLSSTSSSSYNTSKSSSFPVTYSSNSVGSNSTSSSNNTNSYQSLSSHPNVMNNISSYVTTVTSSGLLINKPAVVVTQLSTTSTLGLSSTSPVQSQMSLLPETSPQITKYDKK